MRGYFNDTSSSNDFTAAMGAAQYKQQGAIGKYNQAVANRNALVFEGQSRSNRSKKQNLILHNFKKILKNLKVQLLLHLLNLV
jgi:hypothetical protein